jgi:sugar phosphate isomerase/epimerase
VGVCWNCNNEEVENGSIKANFKLLQEHIRNVHIHELYEYPYKELFGLLRGIGYDRYLLVEAAHSLEPERYLSYYHALFHEMLGV